MIINSAPLLPHQTKELLNLLPGTNIYVYYGLTEASRSSFVCLSGLDPTLYTTVGKAMDSVNISLENTTKEILISGPTVSKAIGLLSYLKYQMKISLYLRLVIWELMTQMEIYTLLDV